MLASLRHASVQPDDSAGFVRTKIFVYEQVGVNHVTIPAGTTLTGAKVDKRLAYCTPGPAWFALGEARSVCLFDAQGKGCFSEFYVLGTIKSATFPMVIPYEVVVPTPSELVR